MSVILNLFEVVDGKHDLAELKGDLVLYSLLGRRRLVFQYVIEWAATSVQTLRLIQTD